MRMKQPQHILIVLGALLAFLSFFFVFPPTAFFPNGLSVQWLSNLLTQTLAFLPGRVRNFGTVFPFGFFLIYLGDWVMLLLALMQVGLSLWTLCQESRRAHTWSIHLASLGLILILLAWGGNLLFAGLLMAALAPARLGGLLLAESRFFAPPLIGFLLILIMRVLSHPRGVSSVSGQVPRSL